MSAELQDYRKGLVTLEQKAQDDYDKAILSLSGGALGVTFVFLKDIVGAGQLLYKTLIFWAWISWGLSVAFTLFSFMTSNFSIRKAIKRLDEGALQAQRPGGFGDLVTVLLNVLAGVLFFAGLILFAVFALNNLETINSKTK